MAYPVISSPYGFRPINELNGLPYAGATRLLAIKRNYATPIFYGDLVQFKSGEFGCVISTELDATDLGTGNGLQIGVFMGCSYTNPSTGQKLFAQYYPGNIAANDIVAYVVDDPSAVFKVVVVAQVYDDLSNFAAGTPTVGNFSQVFVGSNVYAITGPVGSTVTGDSKMAVSADPPQSSGTAPGAFPIGTSTLPFRVVALVPETGITLTGTGTAANSTTITLAAAIPGLQAGMQLVAPGGTGAVNAGDFNYVVNVNGTTITVADNVTLSSTPVSFVGFPEVLVKWNQGIHAYQNATGTAD